MTAEEFAVIFFDHWYCENGLPLQIVSDRDKLFISRFWRAFTKLAGIKLRMSTSFHPETDGSSERTNKTVNQCLQYHVERNQKGWSRALPRVRFQIMNTVNLSTGFSPFQLRMGRSPRVLPPLVGAPSAPSGSDEGRARAVIEAMENDVAEARDNLLAAKAHQADMANKHRGPEDPYKVGDLVMLSTSNRRKEYAPPGSLRATKFFPRQDGPYRVERASPDTSNYTLEMPNATASKCRTFHASQLTRFVANDPNLFPSRTMTQDGPVIMDDGSEEYVIERIVDERRWGRGWRYLVRWKGWGPEEDRWMSRKELEETEALDIWLQSVKRD